MYIYMYTDLLLPRATDYHAWLPGNTGHMSIQLIAFCHLLLKAVGLSPCSRYHQIWICYLYFQDYHQHRPAEVTFCSTGKIKPKVWFPWCSEVWCIPEYIPVILDLVRLFIDSVYTPLLISSMDCWYWYPMQFDDFPIKKNTIQWGFPIAMLDCRVINQLEATC